MENGNSFTRVVSTDALTTHNYLGAVRPVDPEISGVGRTAPGGRIIPFYPTGAGMLLTENVNKQNHRA